MKTLIEMITVGMVAILLIASIYGVYQVIDNHDTGVKCCDEHGHFYHGDDRV